MTTAIIGIIGTISGAIIGALITYFALTWIAKRQEFNRAAAIFRSAFIEEQRLLDPHSTADRVGKSTYDILESAINRHEIAMIRFRPYLRDSERIAFARAWEAYCYHEQTDRPFLEQYFDKNLKEKEEKRKLALERIEKLLEFAKPK